MKLLDGGITDSIPLKAAQNLGYDKNIVILTRPSGYRKKSSALYKIAAWIYRKYPKFVEAMANRHLMYNKELDYVAEQEKAGKVLVLRPSRDLKVKKMEHNLNKVKAMYELGRNDAQNLLDKIINFMR